MDFIQSTFDEFESSNLWQTIYYNIVNYVYGDEYSKLTFFEARKIENRPFNRYRDVSPYDQTRVKLVEPNNGTDYINGNLVEYHPAGKRYISTQGPLPETCGAFWQMIWEQNCSFILMLTQNQERERIKCHGYWPGSIHIPDKVAVFSKWIRVSLVSEKDYSDYVIRTFLITDNRLSPSKSEVHKVTQFHFITWPDFDVPKTPDTFLQFLAHYIQYCKTNESEDLSKRGPPVVHCSAGIGRSGMFILVDICLSLYSQHLKEDVDESKEENLINPIEILLMLRRQRMGLIQTHQQLKFAFLAILEGMKRLKDYGSLSLKPILNDSSTSAEAESQESNNAIQPSSDSEQESSEKENIGQCIIDQRHPKENIQDFDDDQKPKPAPRKRLPNADESSTTNINNASSLNNVPNERRQILEDKRRKTREAVEKMRVKQMESERSFWDRNGHWVMPAVILSVTVVVSYLFKSYYY